MANKEMGSSPPEKRRPKVEFQRRRVFVSDYEDDLPHISEEIIYEKEVPPQIRRTTTRSGEIVFDPQTNDFTRADKTVTLHWTYAKIIEQLIDNAGKAVSVQALYEATHPNETIPSENQQRAIRIMMTRLRKKIEDDPSDPQVIRVIPERGYAIAVPHDAEIPPEVKMTTQTTGGEITLNASTGDARIGEGDPISLPFNEHVIVYVLMQQPGRVVSPLELYAACYPEKELDPNDRSFKLMMKVVISKIRKRLGDTDPEQQIIVNHPRKGYSIGFPPQEELSSPE